MAKGEFKIDYHGRETVAVNYKGIQIIQNFLNGSWFLFFKKGGKYESQPPFVGTLPEMKKIVDNAIKINKGGHENLMPEDTYPRIGSSNAKK
jgi:hypothetical protein